MSSLMYIVAPPGELSGQIRARLRELEYSSEVFDSPAALLEAVHQSAPEVVALHSSLLPAGEALETLASGTMVIVFAESMEVDRRLELYRQNVKQVVVAKTDLALQVSLAIKMLYFRNKELHHYRQQSLTQGTVQAFPLQNILQNALLEKKNLIIKVRHPEMDAKLRTFQGHLIHAFTSHLSNEEAVLKLLQLSSGSITIRSYQKLSEYAPISASVAAIIAEARFETLEIQEGLERLCRGLSNPGLVRNTAENQTAVTEEQQQILDLVENETPFQKLLMLSPFPVLKSARLIFQLCQSGRLAARGEGATVEAFQAEDIRYIRDHLLPEGVNEGALIVLGLPGAGRSELVRTIAGFQQAQIKSAQSLEFTRLKLSQDLVLSLCGVSIRESFLPILEKLAEGIIAAVFLVDYQDRSQYEFCRYIFGQIRNLYSFPIVVGITRPGEDETAACQEFRKTFGLPRDIPAVPVNPASFADFRKLLHGLEKETVVSGEEPENA